MGIASILKKILTWNEWYRTYKYFTYISNTWEYNTYYPITKDQIQKDHNGKTSQILLEI